MKMIVTLTIDSMFHFLKIILNIPIPLYIDKKIVAHYRCDSIQKYYYNPNSLEEHLLFEHELLIHVAACHLSSDIVFHITCICSSSYFCLSCYY